MIAAANVVASVIAAIPPVAVDRSNSARTLPSTLTPIVTDAPAGAVLHAATSLNTGSHSASYSEDFCSTA